MNIGWIGAGLIGGPMCERVLNAGHDVRVLCRSKASRDRLAGQGAVICRSVSETVRECGYVITVLPGPLEVRDVYLAKSGILSAAKAGTLCVDMSTSSPSLARELAAAACTQAIDVIDAPVSGGPERAASGDLSIMAGGEVDAFRAAAPILALLGTSVVHHGPAGSGQLAKLVNQVLVAGVTEATCDAFAFASAAQLDLEHIKGSLRDGAGGSPLFDYLWRRLQMSDSTPGFKMSHLVKDLDLATEAASAVGVSLDSSYRILARARSVVSSGGANYGSQFLGWTSAPKHEGQGAP